MIDYTKVSSKIFNILKGVGLNLTMFTNDGSETVDPDEARRFFCKEPNIMVTLAQDEDDIKFNKNKDLALDDVKDLILRLRMLAERYMLKFTLRVFGHDIKPKDYAFDAKKKKAMQMENINEASLSKMYGGKRTSYQRLNDVKMTIKHNLPVDESRKGARSRHIQQIFLECGGERWQFPYTNLLGARAMARHLSMGGQCNDFVGEHIQHMTHNMLQLKEFLHYAKRNRLINENSLSVVDKVKQELSCLYEDLRYMAGVRSYGRVRTRLEENNIDNTYDTADEQVNTLKDMFTIKKFDENIGNMLPLINHVMQGKMHQLRRIEEASNEVVFQPQYTQQNMENFLHFNSQSQRLGNRLINMVEHIMENDELKDYLRQVSNKLCMEGQLSNFEKSILDNVFRNASCYYPATTQTELSESVSFSNAMEKFDVKFI